MAMESLLALALGLATAFLVGLAWYATNHRAENKKNQDHHPSYRDRGAVIAASRT